MWKCLKLFKIFYPDNLKVVMPNVNFDSNYAIQFSVRITAGRPEVGIFHLSDRLVATNVLPEQL